MTGLAVAPSLVVNGRPATLRPDRARRLSEALREDLGLTGTKTGCDAGDCGACTVLLDGAPVCACLTPVGRAEGRAVTTVEGPGLAGLRASFLRHGAAQCGICTPGMLMAAAALLAEVPRPEAAAVRAALGGVLCRCTGYGPIVAAVVDAWREAPPAPGPAAGAAVGAAVARVDGVPRLTGAALYGADLWKPGGVVLKAVRSPHPRAAFAFGDLAGWAAARANVACVLTADDIPGENRFGAIPAYADQPALAEREVRHRGEAVALVAFEDDGSPASLAGFPVAWTPLPAILDPAAAASAPPLHPRRPANLLVEGRVRRGDAAAALAVAAHAAAGAMRTGFVEHAPIEPEAGAAWMEGAVLVIRATTQAPVMDRDETARILALSREQVRIIPSAVGGGFGTKLDVSLQPLLGLAVLKLDRPARMTFTRRESMQATTKRHPAAMTARIGCDASGRLAALEFDGQFDTGAYASWGPTVANRVPVHATGPYRIPAVAARARAVHTNNPVAGAFRGFGVPQATLLLETLIDRLAAAAGIDRLAFRRLNALAPGDATATGQLPGAVGIGACLAALQPRWDRAQAEAAAVRAAAGPGLLRGVGVAACWYGCGNTALPNPSTVRIGLTHAGAIVLHQGATEIGQGSDTVIAQIAADALGVPLAALALVGPDTALTPDAGKTSASRQTFVTGRAALAAARALRAAVLRLANAGEGATLLPGADGLRVAEDGRVALLDLAGLQPDAAGYALSATETYDPPTAALDADGQGAPYAVYGWGAQIAEVAVDAALGTVRVLRVTAAHDVGRAINPALARGQIEGGIAQGLGLALMEEYLPGRTENLHDYLIPTTDDMPEVEAILVEVPDPEGPMGAKGLGEHALIPTAPAILNAIRDATGATLAEVPVLPHRLRAAIRAAGGGR
ncbi:MAG: molybdopterin-dependent oxidoreductase [Rhodobacteraceae bacterium]|jgi:CO/xanthine dehydrogenase Mo-binding subunit/aerobic-type carbon monoxide dehydrogenase small subunit (CoxS/CutS family)|nr:molybdopterin-dependent oxidoreductase [Paracoccaceae bacterium]